LERTGIAHNTALGISFAAGVGLWSASLVLVSASIVLPIVVKGLGFIAALLFALVAVRIFFFAYPFLVATLVGWAWVHYRGAA
jgi:hypothetical protein